MTKVDTFVFFYIHFLTIIEINSKGGDTYGAVFTDK